MNREPRLRSRRILIVLLVAVLVVVILRETGVLGLTWYRSTADSVTMSSPGLLERFKGVSEVIIVDEQGREEMFRIQDGDHRLRLRVRDRFSSWPLLHWLPFYKTGTSHHRIYFGVENNLRGEGWNTWAMVVYKDRTATVTATGILSAHDYRQMIIDDLVEWSASDFDILKDDEARVTQVVDVDERVARQR